VIPAKAAEPIVMLSGMFTQVGPRNHLLDEGLSPMCERAILRGGGTGSPLYSIQGSHKPGIVGNFVNLEKSGNLRYGQGIFCDISHGSRLAYRNDELVFACNV